MMFLASPSWRLRIWTRAGTRSSAGWSGVRIWVILISMPTRVHRCTIAERRGQLMPPRCSAAMERTHGDNRPLPVRSLRDWLDHLTARDRLVVVKPGIGLRFDLAAIAKRLDGLRAT